MSISPDIEQLVTELAETFGRLDEVEAVVLSGSQVTDYADASADVDLYVYARDGVVDLSARQYIIRRRADAYEINNMFWETGDEWIEREGGIHVDMTYRDVGWVIDEVQRVLVYHEARLGYSTCLWHNVRHSRPLYDRGNWFTELKKTTDQPYPEPLMHKIIQKNHPVLRESQSSYLSQINQAVERDDFVSVQHRTTAVLASYFDILFALNRLPHPGEKRLLAIAEQTCTLKPDNLREVVTSALYGDDPVQHINNLVDNLDELLNNQGLMPGRMP